MPDSESFSDTILELAEEFVARYRNGERPSIAEYVHKHPQWEAEIRDVFSTLAAVERIAIDEESLNVFSKVAATPELTQIGDYRIIREVGRGAWGSSTRRSKSR